MKQFLEIFSSSLLFLIVLTLPNGSDGKSWEEDMTITWHEKRILDEFRALVMDKVPLDYMKEEYFLIRWLRTKNFNVYEAEGALMNYVKWRRETRMDNIFKEDWADFNREYPYHIDSRDKEGRPILYISAKTWDLRQAVVSGRRDRFNRYLDKALEEVCALVRDLGDKYKNVSQGVLILNVDGFNLAQHGCLQCISSVIRILVAYEQHHPGMADKVLVVNVPAIAEPVLNAAKAVLHPITREALEVYGTNRNMWEGILRRYVNMDQLPQELGGNLVYDDYGDYFN